MGTKGSIPAGKAAGGWNWTVTSTPQHSFMTVLNYIIKYRDNITFFIS
jgi:hypothetical protein